MPRKTLTQAFVDRVAPPKIGRVEYWDTVLPGFGLRITENNARSWTMLFRVDGKLQRVTLPITDYSKVADARARAREILSAGRKGADIAPLVATPDAEPARRDTLRAAAASFVERYAKRTQRRWRETKRILDVYVLPRLGDKRIGEIRRLEIAELLDDIEDKKLPGADGDLMGGPVMADRTLAALRKVLNWYAGRNSDFNSPIVKGMARTKPRERARTRNLSDEELRALWPHLGAAGVFGAFVKTLLLTAQRRDEVLSMRRSEIKDGIWTIPAERYKTKRAHVVPLSPAARAIIEAVSVIKVDDKDSDLVFTLSGRSPFQGVSKAKDRLDKASGVTGWTLHDLRRTAKTLMSRAGVRPDISERVLGHTLPDMEKRYDRHAYLNEKRDALKRLAETIDGILNPPPRNVVRLHA